MKWKIRYSEWYNLWKWSFSLQAFNCRHVLRFRKKSLIWSFYCSWLVRNFRWNSYEYFSFFFSFLFLLFFLFFSFFFLAIIIKKFGSNENLPQKDRGWCFCIISCAIVDPFLFIQYHISLEYKIINNFCSVDW